MDSKKEALAVCCRKDFSVFFQRAWKEIEPSDYEHNWHIDCLSEYLEQSYKGKYKRLIINVPPRTGKTLLVNVCFAAWLLGQDPSLRIIGVSYSQRLSESIAYKMRLLMESDWYKSIFPETVLDKDQSQKSNFMTTKMGARYSTSVGGAVTGMGADYILVDDPVNPAESLSDVQRMNSNEWIRQSLFTRLNKPSEGRIIVIMQRLHDDDTTGNLLTTGEWEHVKMPAFSNKPIEFSPSSSEYILSDYLHGGRLGSTELDELHESMGAYAFAGQYMQEPVPIGGGEFTKEMLNFYARTGFDVRNCNLFITVDPANSKKKNSDYTVMVVWALAPDQNYYVIDAIRERINPTERVDRLFELHQKWNKRSGKPSKVGYESVGMMTDTHYIRKKQEEINYRFSIQEIKSRMNKEDRIRRLIPLMEGGRVWLPNDLFVKNHKGLSENLINVIIEKELLLFPVSKHDDFMDAMAMIFDINPSFPSINSFVASTEVDFANEAISVLDI